MKESDTFIHRVRLAVFQFHTNTIVLRYFGLSRKHPSQFVHIINAERGLVRWDVKIALKKQQKTLREETLEVSNFGIRPLAVQHGRNKLEPNRCLLI